VSQSDHESSPPVVITGMGVITPLGQTLETFWQHLAEGHSGIRRITQFDASDLPCQVAGEIPDFDPSPYLSIKEIRHMSRVAQISLATASLAVEDAALPMPAPDPERFGVYFGTAIGGIEKAVNETEVLRREGHSRVNPFALPSALPNMSAFYIAHTFDFLGPNLTIATACATGTQVIGEAARAIQAGYTDVAIACGAEALIQDFTIGGFCAMRALPVSFNRQPEAASRPFDSRREGFVFSEGAACLILESLPHAEARRAPRIYAQVAGYASSGDVFHIAAPDPQAIGAIRTMRWALKDSGVAPEDIDYINAHGSGTPANDVMETVAIKQVFGERAYRIPISSTKSMIGHAMGASGAIEAVVVALTLQHGFIHPTINLDFPDPLCDLDYVPHRGRSTPVQVAISNSFGLGGQSASLVLKKVD
jgi:3-oxoacyl-[acyl-carrier-protein] synthase II